MAPNEDSVRKCAVGLLDTLHLVMKTTGAEMRRKTPPVLSVQQFRAVIAIELNESAPLSRVADHMGATISSASKIIDTLVERGYVKRDTDQGDRRRLVLALTEEGRKALRSVHMAAVDCFVERLRSLTQPECEIIGLAMNLIHSAFSGPPSHGSQEVDI